MQNSLGSRLKKNYEDPFRIYLPKRLPLVIRLDGRAFHTLTRGLNKPWDKSFMVAMDYTALGLAQEVQTTILILVQSDELSLLLHNYKQLNSEAWFDNNLQKITSISASIASTLFSEYWSDVLGCKTRAYFDSRAFVLPEAEVNNYFLFRQQDSTRNAIQMLGQAHFSHKQLQNKSCAQIQEMLWQEHGINFNDYEPYYKRGRCVVKGDNGWHVDRNIPVFSQDKNYIEQWLLTDD